jgi:hypothetical protein
LEPNSACNVLVACQQQLGAAEPSIAAPFDPAGSRGVDRDVAATLTLPELFAYPSGEVEVPVRVSTALDIVFFQFTVEYDSTLVAFLSAQVGSDASAAGLTSLGVNTALPFVPAAPDLNNNVLVQIFAPTGSSSLSGEDREVARLRFAILAQPVVRALLRFDTRMTDQRHHTLLTSSDGVDLVDEALGVVDGAIDIVNVAIDPFVYLGTLWTGADGKGELRLKSPEGVVLPCRLPGIESLQGLPVEVRTADSRVLLRGSIPLLGGE